MRAGRGRDGRLLAVNDSTASSGHRSARALAVARRALAESLAARAILADRDAWPWLAVPHLRQGWEALLEAKEASSDREQPLADRVRAARWMAQTKTETHRVAEELERTRSAPEAGENLPDGVTRDALRRHARVLQAEALSLVQPRLGPRARRFVWWGLAGAAAFATLLLVVSAGRVPVVNEPKTHGWLGRYYAAADFTGTPIVRYDDSVSFRWARAAPLEDLPADDYSIRWDSCLSLNAPRTVHLRLRSDDGSRLFVDDERVIDNWRRQATRLVEREITLDRGAHHLRVEYFEGGGDAQVSLELRGISREQLRTPRLDGETIECPR